MSNKKAYYNNKEKAKQKAISIQYKISQNNYSYYTLVIIQNYLYKLAKKNGLIKEFKENGLL